MRTRATLDTRLRLLRVLIAGMTVLASVALGVMPAAPALALPPVTTSSGAIGSTSALSTQQSGIVPAADLRQFNAGNIISDEVFFNPTTMSEVDIDHFLRGKVTSCVSGYVCLKDYRQSTANKAADSYCDGYSGASNEPAARIIYKVAVSCGINPQVLLVTLQKEQSLVTNVWPSSFRYTAAMGHNCPDTAACDPRYAGFQNQVYGAARQFQIYAEGRYFTYYAPGKTWNILYNPSRACGSSPVYVANRATASLYYYTPYQPNPAAIAAGYGLGDGCSAYGNRNFYQYFVDWFGSTQISNMTIVKTASSADVFLISGGERWRIEDGESYGELNAAFGPLRVIGDAPMKAFALKGTTKSVLRDTSTGTIGMVQGGQMHRVPSCALVEFWGSSCANPTNVSSSLFNRLSKGAEVGKFFQVRGTSAWGRFDSASSATPLHDARAAAAVNGTPAATPYAPYISTDRYARLSKSAPYFAPVSVVKSDADSKVYLTVDFDKLVWIRNWSEVAEFGVGAGSLITVPAADLSRYRDSGLALKAGLRCGGSSFFVTSGKLAPVASPATVGLPALDVGEPTCAQLPSTGPAIGTSLAVKTAASPVVSIIEGGKQRPVLSWSLLVEANGGTAPNVLTVQPTTLATFPAGAALADGQVVKLASSPDIMFVSGSTAYRIPSAGVAADLGIGLAFTLLTPEGFAGLTKGPDVGAFVTCGAQGYLAASGTLWPVTGKVMAPAPTAQTLSAAACARLKLTQGTPQDRVFVKSPAAGDVYAVEAGTARHVSSWGALIALAGTASPQILVLSSNTLASMPKGSRI